MNSAPAPRAELTRAHIATTEPDPHAHEPAARPNRVPDELIDGGSVSLELSRCRRRRPHGGPPPPPAAPPGSERPVHPRAATAVRPCPPPHLRVACMGGASAAAAWPALPAGPCSRRSACLQVQVTVHRPAQPNPRPDNQRRGQGTRLGPAPRAPRGLLRPGAVDGQGDRDRVGRCAPHPPSRARSSHRTHVVFAPPACARPATTSTVDFQGPPLPQPSPPSPPSPLPPS